jgi:hypothetical protein
MGAEITALDPARVLAGLEPAPWKRATKRSTEKRSGARQVLGPAPKAARASTDGIT